MVIYYHDILAADFGEMIEVVAMLVIALIVGIGQVLKKKKSGEEGEGTKVITTPPPELKAPSPPSAMPSRPSPVPPPTKPVPVARARQQLIDAYPPAQRATEPARTGVVRPAPVPRVEHPTQQKPRRMRVTSTRHAVELGAHAEDVAEHLVEEQKVKWDQPHDEVESGRPAPPPKRSLRQTVANLNPQSMKQAVVLSEILKPPIGLREEPPI